MEQQIFAVKTYLLREIFISRNIEIIEFAIKNS